METMIYRYLGDSGLRVSVLGLGTMEFGSKVSQGEAANIYSLARDNGVNLVDTSSTYANGQSETIVGSLIKQDRQNIVLCSKVFFPTESDVNASGLSKKHIRATVMNSLKRLNTDYIDVYYLHQCDKNVNFLYILEEITWLIQKGYLQYYGLSNFSAWEATKLHMLCSQYGFAKPLCMQPVYNLLQRQAEAELLTMANHFDIGVIVYSPTAGGLLTGKYCNSNIDALDHARLRDNLRYKKRYFKQSYLNLANKLVDYCVDYTLSPIDCAMQWLINNKSVDSILIGPRNSEQCKRYLDSLNVTWSENDSMFCNDLFGHNIIAVER